MGFNFKNKGFKNYTYAQLLDTDIWRNKRLEILAVYDYTCCKCLRQATELVSIEGKYFAISNNRLITINDQIVLKPQIIFYDNPTILHVHHKYYMLSKLPWEYEKQDLITLCNDCHNMLHDTTQVSVYLDERKILIDDLTECPRCDGHGYLSDYSHVQAGICFRCKGAKYLELADAVFKG